MVNIKVGDRVVDKTTGKHGTVDSFFKPMSFGYKQKTYARVLLDGKVLVNVEPHNLAIEEGYKKEKYDNIGVNNQNDPNDKVESLTPAKPKGRKKKVETEEVMDEIVNAVE